MVGEDGWYSFNFLKFTEAWLVTPRCGLCWRMFHVHLRRCILLLDGMSWRYQWDTFHIIYHLRVVFPYSFCFDDVSIGVRRMLKSPTIIVLLSISPFMSVNVCLTYWGAPMLNHGIWSHHFMANRWGKSGNSGWLFWGVPKSLQMVTAAMKLKDTYSLEGKLWPT